MLGMTTQFKNIYTALFRIITLILRICYYKDHMLKIRLLAIQYLSVPSALTNLK